MSLEDRHLERANAAMREERWSDAAVEWEILRLLRPDYRDYASALEEARSRATNAATAHVQAAAQARQRGELQQAAQLYLKALSADPARRDAAQALREIERERALRIEVNTVVNLANSERSSKNRAPRPPPGPELEAAVVMLRQGDYDTSIKVLEDYLRRNPGDPVAKQSLREAYKAIGKQRMEQGKKEEALVYLEKAQDSKRARATEVAATVGSLRKDLAQEYYEKGLRAQRDDLDEAIRLWELSLQYDPQLTAARMRLQQARRMQEGLQSIDGSPAK
jgi:tetratricopeptide (TPR) repeat protein